MIINIKITGEQAEYLDVQPINSKDLKLQLSFDDSWDEYTKKNIIVRYLEAESYYATVDSNGLVTVPVQVVAYPGFNISVLGESSGGRTVATQEFFVGCQVFPDPANE